MGAVHAILHVKIMQLTLWAFELILYHIYFHRHLLQDVIIHLSQCSAYYNIFNAMEGDLSGLL